MSEPLYVFFTTFSFRLLERLRFKSIVRNVLLNFKMGDLLDFFDPRKPINKVILKVTFIV